MSIIVFNCQHYDEQQFQTLSCVHYSIFSVVKLDLFIRALLLDRILALEKTTRTLRVYLVKYAYVRGVLSYADDITLLCPSIRGLNEMMYICCEYAEEYNIVFNTKKNW